MQYGRYILGNDLTHYDIIKYMCTFNYAGKFDCMTIFKKLFVFLFHFRGSFRIQLQACLVGYKS